MKSGIIHPNSIKFNGEFIIKPHDPETFFNTRNNIPTYDPETFLNSSNISFKFTNSDDTQTEYSIDSPVNYSKKTIDLIKEQNRLKIDIKKLYQKLQLLKYRDDIDTINEYEQKKADLDDLISYTKQSIVDDKQRNYDKHQKKLISARKQYLKRIGISKPNNILNIENIHKPKSSKNTQKQQTVKHKTKNDKSQHIGPSGLTTVDIGRSQDIDANILKKNKLLAQIRGIQTRINKIEDEFIDQGGDIDDIIHVSEWNELEQTKKKLRYELDNL